MKILEQTLMIKMNHKENSFLNFDSLTKTT